LNIKYELLIDPGWTGSDCLVDVAECPRGTWVVVYEGRLSIFPNSTSAGRPHTYDLWDKLRRHK